MRLGSADDGKSCVEIHCILVFLSFEGARPYGNASIPQNSSRFLMISHFSSFYIKKVHSLLHFSSQHFKIYYLEKFDLDSRVNNLRAFPVYFKEYEGSACI